MMRAEKGAADRQKPCKRRVTDRMYKTIIHLKENIPDELLRSLASVIERAFINRAGSLRNVSTEPHEFVFQGGENQYGCLDLGMLSLGRTQGFLNFVQAWKWIDEDPDESCDMIEVFAQHPLI